MAPPTSERLTRLANRHYQARAATVAVANRTAAREWRRFDPRDPNATWPPTLARLLTLLTAAQTRAAAQADPYVAATLAAQGADPAQAAVVASALGGVASDGRDLADLLATPLIYAMQALRAGASVSAARQAGAVALRTIVTTQVADAGRVADGVALTATEAVGGYVRMVEPPACPRCAILAGRWYRWSDGFLRHPNCQCIHIPASEDVGGDLRTDPKLLFEHGQIKGLSAADERAIRDGANMNQVVNAHRSARKVTIAGRPRGVTLEGITRRGLAGRRLQDSAKARGFRPGTDRFRFAAGVRLTPEEIYREANGNRAEAIRLLRRFGYIL